MTRLASLLALGCLSGFGQYSGKGNTIPGISKSLPISAQSRSTPVTGAPYSGEIVSETVQTLADGTHIRHATGSTKVYRDSFGRTRQERSGPADQAPNATERPILIAILDPVGQVKYTLEVRGKVAYRQMLLAPAAGTAVASRPSSEPVSQTAPITDLKTPQSVKDQLKNQIIEGVLASGTRTTTTWPEGSVGNDGPIIVVQESWWSMELKVWVLQKTTDPRSGESTEKLTNISRSEPDQSLFQPPPDYTIVDEKGSFTIMWGRAQQ
jgi:hypothetical protein